MDKIFDHKKHESEILKSWKESGTFVAPNANEVKESGKTPFCIIMPPPNANDPLHVGHAMFVTVEDIFARYHRMKGEAVLWLPGTDHAGIETQFVFEKKLAKDGKSRFDFERDVLYQMILEYVQDNSGVAMDQMKKLGASADWSRYKFTLDEDIVSQVKNTFLKLYKDNLVYRAERLVNYCTKCGTSYSELEVVHEEKVDKLYVIDYGEVRVATTRPETMLGDVAVAVNPKDKRFAGLVGKKVVLPLVGREIPIVADEMVDMEFGTGAVKITPSHDPNDWEVAVRAGFDMKMMANDFKIIDERGKMTEKAGKYSGLSISIAREQVIADLGEKLIESKPYTHSVGVCYRCGRVIEPLPRSQFFIKVKPLSEKVLAALDKKETKILGAGREKILRHWLLNLRDWNVSRQIVWGIQMPVWYPVSDSGEVNKDSFVVSIEKPEGNFVQETDTFDTWFSSGQWPVVTLKSTLPGDFETYYPTTLMETGYDILPFWVMRMMMLCIYLTGKSPFSTVYLHGLVRDEKGQKMSKSKGNVSNPLELSEKYGTDALRMALVLSTVAGQDSNTGENKVRGMRNFGNKIWNAGRFVKEMEKTSPEGEVDLKVVERMNEIESKFKILMDKYQVGLASEYTYNEFWHWYCDEVIEKAKTGDVSNDVMETTFKKFLLLLHPFVPFVTEAVWKEMGGTGLLSEKVI